MTHKFDKDNPDFKVIKGGKKEKLKDLNPKKTKHQEEKSECGDELEEMCPECRDEEVLKLVVEDALNAFEGGEDLELVMQGLYVTAVEIGYRMALENKILDMADEIREMNDELVAEFGTPPVDPEKH